MKQIIAASFLIVLWVACGTSTHVTGVWRSEENKDVVYRNILVAAITENATNKHVVEGEMTKQLKSNAVKASSMNEVLPYKFTGKQEEKEVILAKAREHGLDGILTFTLIKQKEETRYVPGSDVYAPPIRYGHYGTFGGYYGYYGTRMYDPGYYTNDEIYFIETNLYDVKTEKLVWSVQSKTYNPSGINQFAQDFTQAITKQLIQSHIIEPEVAAK